MIQVQILHKMIVNPGISDETKWLFSLIAKTRLITVIFPVIKANVIQSSIQKLTTPFLI